MPRHGLHAAAYLLVIGLAPSASSYDWQSVPTSVGDLSANITADFLDSTALLTAYRGGVIGGTGSADAPLAYMQCSAAGCKPAGNTADEYIAVIEEADLAQLLREIASATSLTGSNIAQLPAGVISLPGAADAPDSPAAARPQVDYSAGNKHEWNPVGTDTVSLTLPCGVFLAPNTIAAELRAKARRNSELGPSNTQYGAVVSLESRLNASSTSQTCVDEGLCEPLGGHSVWAALPPHTSEQAPRKRQIVVLSNWDSLGLFRSRVRAAHASYSGLISMFVAADMLSTQWRAGSFASSTHEIIFMALTAESIGLLGSRRLLFELEQGSNTTSGLDLSRVDIVIQAGMTAAPGSGDTSQLYAHTPGQHSPAQNALVTAGAATTSAQVSLATKRLLPPSSLRLWQNVLPESDLVYLGDFDEVFENQFFGSYKDDGKVGYSVETIARAGVALGYALKFLASKAPPPSLPDSRIDGTANKLAVELNDCLVKTGGVACSLVQDMTHSLTQDTVTTAQQRAMPLTSSTYTLNPTNHSGKFVIERFAWEFLANRTFAGKPSKVKHGDGDSVGCNPSDAALDCSSGQVCMHSSPTDDTGRCVTATVRFVPALSTEFVLAKCGDYTCFNTSQSDRASRFTRKYGLPDDPMWVETYNDVVTTSIGLRDPASLDDSILAAGVVVSAAAAITVFMLRRLFHKRLDAL